MTEIKKAVCLKAFNIKWQQIKHTTLEHLVEFYWKSCCSFQALNTPNTSTNFSSQA